jgi:hypothetical protein
MEYIIRLRFRYLISVKSYLDMIFYINYFIVFYLLYLWDIINRSISIFEQPNIT